MCTLFGPVGLVVILATIELTRSSGQLLGHRVSSRTLFGDYWARKLSHNEDETDEHH